MLFVLEFVALFPVFFLSCLQALRDAFPSLRLALRGTDDEGDPVHVSCGAFARYMLAQDSFEVADEEPLVAFDVNVLYDSEALSALYTLPDVERLQLRMGLLERLPDMMQPPLRWLILGPTRSGTFIHQDPPGTCAWNVDGPSAVALDAESP